MGTTRAMKKEETASKKNKDNNNRNKNCTHQLFPIPEQEQENRWCCGESSSKPVPPHLPVRQLSLILTSSSPLVDDSTTHSSSSSFSKSLEDSSSSSFCSTSSGEPVKVVRSACAA